MIVAYVTTNWNLEASAMIRFDFVSVYDLRKKMKLQQNFLISVNRKSVQHQAYIVSLSPVYKK